MERYFIFGIDVVTDATGNKMKKYRVLKAATNDACDESSWKFERYLVTEKDVVGLIRRNATVMNASINEKGELIGSPAAFGRFNAGALTQNDIRRPLILVAERITENGVRLGHVVADYNGAIKSFSAQDMKKWIESCENYKRKDGTSMFPFQNVKITGKNDDGNYIIAAYPHQDIMKSIVANDMQKAKHLNKPKTTVDDSVIEKKMETKKASKYSEENKKIIIAARDDGYDIRPLLNPAFNKAQLNALITAMKSGVNVSAYAKPEIPADYMKFCTKVEKFGYNSNFLTKEILNPSQRVQVLLGLIAGVDVSKYAKASIPAQEMEQIRMRLADSFWGNGSYKLGNDGNSVITFKDSLN